MKSSHNNVISSFISWSQNILPMKFFDTLFQISKTLFRLRREKIKVIRVKYHTFVNDLKNL